MKSNFSVFGWILTAALAVPFCALSAQETGTAPVADKSAREYRDKKSGDEALRSQDFSTAASFYSAYRRQAEKERDEKAVRDAFECEINAWILCARPTPAETLLADYLKRFPGHQRPAVELWQANILLLRRDPDAAKKILNGLLPRLDDKDPLKFRAYIALAAAHELKYEYGDAANIYKKLSSRKEDSDSNKNADENPSFRRRIAERRILVLLANGDTSDALNLLKDLKLAEDESSLKANMLLNVYLSLKNNDAANLVKVSWPEVRDIDPGTRTDNFFFLTSSLIGDEFLKIGNYANAADAYRLAFRCARTRNEAFEAVKRLAAMLTKLDRRDQAAEIALKHAELFRSPNAFAPDKLFAARLFAETGRLEEALALYTQLFDEVKNDPASVNSTFETALAQLLRAENFDAADKLIDLRYGKKPALRGAALIRHADVAKARGDLKQAVKLFLEAAEAAKTDAPLVLSAWNRAAETAAALRDWDTVIAVSENILNRDPNAPVLFLRARALENSKRENSARECYITYGTRTKNVSDESKADALFRAAALFFRDKKFPEAGKYFGKVFEDFPKSKVAPAAGYWQILVCRACDAPGPAEKITDDLKKRFPDSEYTGMALLKLADYYKDRGDQKKAGKLLNDIMNGKNRPEIRAQAHYQKALLAYHEKKYGEAMELLQNDDTAGWADAWFLRGDILKAGNRFPEAMEAYRRAAGLRPGSPLAQAALGAEADCHFAQASYLDKTAEFSAALKLYLELLEQKDLLPEFELMTRYKAGRCQQLLGDFDAAANTYREVMNSIPADDFDKQPAEYFWIVKSIAALEQIALKNPRIETINAALKALSRLARSGIGDPGKLKKRMQTLRKIKSQLSSAGENKL